VSRGRRDYSAPCGPQAPVTPHATRKILFVCRANICRGPMAMAILNTLAKDAGLGVRAESAGVAALEGAEMDPKARAVLEEMGIYPECHRARQATRALLEEADLVLTMSRRQSAQLIENIGAPLAKVQALLEYSNATGGGREGIVDPHGRSLQAYRATSRELFGYADLLLHHLTGETNSP
jgi:protein-tyrosine-phosphatase